MLLLFDSIENQWLRGNTFGTQDVQPRAINWDTAKNWHKFRLLVTIVGGRVNERVVHDQPPIPCALIGRFPLCQ
jgi:hypothetical protein